MRYFKEFVVFLVLLFICGFLLNVTYTDIESKIIAQVNSEQIAHAGQAAAGIESFFANYNNSLSFLAGNNHIILLDSDGKELMRDFFNTHAGEIASVTRVDENGTISYTYPFETFTGADISSQSHVRQQMNTHAVVTSDVFTSVQGFKAVAFNTPVYENGTFKGSIGILIPLDTLIKENLENIRVIDSGYAWAINQNGVVLYSPYPKHVGKSVFEVFNNSPSVTAMAREAMKGSRGTSQYTVYGDPIQNFSSTKYQAIYLPVTIGTTYWSIIISTPENEILSTIQGFRNTLIIISLLLIISLLFFAYYVARAHGIVQEEKKRRTAEEALRASEAKYQRLIETANEGIWIVDWWISTSFVNQRFADIIGYTREEMIGHQVLEYVIDEDKDIMENQFIARKNGIKGRYECRLRHKDGTIIWCLFSGSPLLDDAGSFQGSFGMVTDITERKLAEQKLLEAHRDLEKKVEERTLELSDANRHLQELDRLKSMFIASMSHELRTPLNSIIGFTGIMAKGMTGPINPEQKKQLSMVQDSARHLLALINDVIDISKIEAGKIEAGVSTFDLTYVIHEVGDTFSKAAEERGLVLNIDIPGPITVTSDERRIKQIIINIVSNAIKFTDEGSIDIIVEQKGTIAKISVRDTGIGITREDFSKLFRPFVRVQEAGRRTEGTGLGLYLSLKIARFLGGDITAESEPGRGSVFTFSCPLTYEKQEDV